jgi:hypothetical protein
VNDIDWNPVHQYVSRLVLPAALPIAGTADWQAADSDTKTAALIVAGSRWCLEEQMLTLRQRRAQMKLASIEVAQSKDWAAVARQIRDRDAFMRDNADWAIRRSA